jgi:hypothetical protein
MAETISGASARSSKKSSRAILSRVVSRATARRQRSRADPSRDFVLTGGSTLLAFEQLNAAVEDDVIAEGRRVRITPPGGTVPAPIRPMRASVQGDL